MISQRDLIDEDFDTICLPRWELREKINDAMGWGAFYGTAFTFTLCLLTWIFILEPQLP